AVIPLPAVEKPPVVTQTRKEVVVVDPDKVPKEYWALDMFRIRADALSGIVIPGVEVRETQVVVAR
ncbi:MAG: hypothetical protein RMK43_12860, partial [Cyclobacteriaceae bacterium]|nr:hypothetical protein [Cyclobacteriaceae bacterium]